MPRAYMCCRRLSLRDGSLAIGYFCTVVGVLVLVACVIFLTAQLSSTPEKVEDGLSQRNNRQQKTAFIVGAVLALGQILASASLIYGVYKGKTDCLVLWLVYGVIGYLLSKAATIFLIIKFFSGERSAIAGVGVLAFQSALFAYFLMIVNKYRETLQEEFDDLEKLVQIDTISEA